MYLPLVTVSCAHSEVPALFLRPPFHRSCQSRESAAGRLQPLHGRGCLAQAAENRLAGQCEQVPLVQQLPMQTLAARVAGLLGLTRWRALNVGTPPS